MTKILLLLTVTLSAYVGYALAMHLHSAISDNLAKTNAVYYTDFERCIMQNSNVLNHENICLHLTALEF